MLPLNMLELKREDFEQLITNGVRESKTIEYKQELPGNSDFDKKEFLGDVSAFANSGGGDLVYGMKCEDGLPFELIGVEIDNVDATTLKYESIIKDGLAPRIGCEIECVELESNRYILVIRVLPSWNSPHRVVFKGHDRFYARNSAGKYLLDVDELRNLFTSRFEIEERMRRFVDNRIMDIYTNSVPYPLSKGAKMILHIVPFNSFTSGINYNIDKMRELVHYQKQIGGGGFNTRINLDGHLTFCADSKNQVDSYVQLFRNGIIEAVESSSLQCQKNEKYSLASVWYEKELMEALQNYKKTLENLGVPLPIIVNLTFVGVKGYVMAVKNQLFRFGNNECDRDILRLPESLINSWDTPASEVLLPIFNTVWNAFGYEKSENFDENGNWIE